MTADKLYCRCGGEVRIVRLTPRYLSLGHVRNPKDQHHIVRLARSGPAPAIFEDGGNPGRSEVPDSGVTPDETPRARSASRTVRASHSQDREVHPKGRAHGQDDSGSSTRSDPTGAVPRATLRAPSSPAGKARSSRGCPPAPAPRLARSAGRSDTAGD